MRERLRKRTEGSGGQYFAAPTTSVQFIHTGCKLLDLALGGGWARRRVGNIVGDSSTGKTLLCIEASANFAREVPKAIIRYRECESAFDTPYAGAVGMPLDRVDFGDPLDTVEDLFEDLQAVIEGAKGPELYIVDSLDALSDRDELSRDLSKGSYGMNKPKMMSRMFRQLIRSMSAKDVTVLFVSQIRDKINAMYGPKTTRSGGRALDFYSSQILRLIQLGKLSNKISGLKRVTAIKVKAMVNKNKIALANREAQFNIRFGYGIDDGLASLEFLKACGRLKDAGIKQDAVKEHARAIMNGEVDPKELNELVTKVWYEIEKKSVPTKSKYGT